MGHKQKPGRISRLKMALFGAGLLLLLLVALIVLSFRTRNIYSIRASGLNVREQPSLSSPPTFRIERGDYVFLQGEREEQNGLVWMRVFFLFTPEDSDLDERMDGWIAEKGVKRTFVEKEPNLLKKILVLRNFYKWKIRSSLRHRVSRSKHLSSIRVLVPVPADKLLHVFVMFLLGSFLFVFFLSGLRFPSGLSFLASVAGTNLIGLLNELIDLLSGKGAFETMDMAANAMGSAGILAPFLIHFLWKTVRPAGKSHDGL